MNARRYASLTAIASALFLTGCASVAPDGLRSDVQQQTQNSLPTGAQLSSFDKEQKEAARTQVADWLKAPVDADTAVRIALLNSPALQAQLADLAAQDAQRAQALTLFNPTLTLGRFTSGHEREIERQLSFSLVNVITLPWRSRWLGWQMEQATLTASQQVLITAAQTRRAWLRAVAAEQELKANEQMFEAAQLGAELARRMTSIGNFNKLDQARELSLQHEAAAQLSRARLAAHSEREQLAQLMGVWGPQADFQLPAQLPALPKAASDLRSGKDAEQTALRERLDLRALRRNLDETADHGVWAGVGAVFGDIGASYSRNTSTDRATGHDDITRGWEIDLPLPIFDWGGSASAGARANVQRSAAQLTATAIQARGEARTSWLRYRTAWDLAHQQQTEVLPLAKLVQDETVLRYNGMFASVWELLGQARKTTQAVVNATQAQRDFWLAETDLNLALMGTSPGGFTALSGAASAASSTDNH